MLIVLAHATSYVLGAVALWTLIEALRAKRPGWFTVIGLGIGELGAVLFSMIACIRWFTDSVHMSAGLFWGYILCVVGVLPIGFWWGIGERSRWGNVVMAVGALTTVVLMWRMMQLWPA